MTTVASTFTFLTKRRGGLLTVIGLIFVLVIFGLIVSDRFGTTSNARNVLEQSTPLALVSLGQTLVVITGGIDLSVGSMVSLASVLLSGITNGDPAMMWVAIAVILGVGVLVGLINAATSIYLGVHPLIVTLGMTQAVWQWMEPVLAARFRVVRFDLIGHGQTVPPDGQPVLGDLSRQLAGLMDHLGVAQAAIVGFSLGGMVARRFAQDYPARARALVILHSPHRRTPDAQAAIQARVNQAKGAGPAATVEAALLRWYTDAARAARPDLLDQTRAWVLANDPKIYPGLYRILAEGIDEVVAPVPPITCPTLVMTADEDHGNGPEMSAAIAADIKGARLVILKGLRHMALAENPEAVNRPVIDFLTEVPG